MAEVQDYIDRITFATSLRGLCSAVEDASDFLLKNDLGDLDDYVAVSALPTFGGEAPTDTNEIWSWDAGELMVTGPDGDFAVIDRDQWGRHVRAG